MREAAVAPRYVGRRQREQHAPVRRRRGPEVLRVRQAEREGEARAPRHGDAELVAVVDPRLADRAVDGRVEPLAPQYQSRADAEPKQ